MPRRVYRWVRNGQLTSGGLRLPALLILGFVALGVLGSAWLVWSTIATERAQRLQAERTTQVIDAINDINRAALNAETGQRGYFITNDRSYLGSYELGSELYPMALDRLKRLMSDPDPQQTQLVDAIERHGDAKFDELARTIELLTEGDIAEARQVVLTNRGRQEMDMLRAALAELEMIETRILREATEETAHAEDQVLPVLVLMILMMLLSLALGFWQALRAAHAEAEAAQAHELEAARDRADLLASELNHRVKNIFAVVLAIVRMSAREQPEAKPVIEGIAGRIHALLVAHETTQGTASDGSGGEANMTALVETVLAPHRSDGNAVTIDGPEAVLSSRQATPLGLVLHELATNAVKYGAWSDTGGSIDIGWEHSGTGEDRELALHWDEHCPTPAEASEREGFGSMLMKSSAQQLGGSVDRNFQADGVRVDLRFPHPETA